MLKLFTSLFSLSPTLNASFVPGQACNCTAIPLISPSKKKNKYEQALTKPEKVSRIPLEETTINHFKNGLMVT